MSVKSISSHVKISYLHMWGYRIVFKPAKRRNEFLAGTSICKCVTHSLTHSNTSEGSREKFTHKEVKFDYQLEDYLKTIRNPAHRISMTKLRLGVHSLRIQTGKYENRGAPIPVDGRTCLVCNRGYIEDERHFLMYCPGYDNIRNELHSLLSTHDVVFKSLNDEGKIRYLLTLENETTSKIVGKYTYLMFQKRKDILNAK